MSTPFPSVAIQNFRIDLNENKARSESVFTRQRQVVSLSGGTSDRWQGLVRTSILEEADTREMMAFVFAVGLYGEFTMEIPGYDGAASGETLGSVVGAGQTGTSLDVDGVTPSTTILQAGEWFQVRNELKLATADCISDGTGAVTLTFKPALRVSPADNDPVDFGSPEILAQLTSMPSLEKSFRPIAEFMLTFEEVLSGV